MAGKHTQHEPFLKLVDKEVVFYIHFFASNKGMIRFVTFLMQNVNFSIPNAQFHKFLALLYWNFG